MSVRLFKICKELNIGVQTAIEFLEKKGFAETWSPISKLSDEQYEMFVREFGAGTRMLALPWKEDSFTSNPDTNREILNSHGWNRKRGDTIMILPTRYILIPKDQSVNKFAFWTIEDFDSKCQHAFEGGKIIKERLSQPSGYLPITPYTDTQRTEKQEFSQEIYRIDSKRNVPKPFVLGTIDLNALNSSTRPQKKSKEEIRRERNDRNDQRKINNHPKGPVKPIESNDGQSSIRDIWQRFVDIQEKLIKQRCSPISIIPDSIEVENDKLYATVDESHSEQQLDSLLKDKLGLTSYDLESGCILVDESLWNEISDSELEQIRKGLSECYVELDTTPSINVTINYGGDMNRSDQLSIEELHQMESILTNGTLIEGSIDNTATFISKVSVQIEDYIKYLFGNHYVTYEKKKKNQAKPKIVELLEYHNQYIPWGVIQQYSHLGLTCKHYTLIFKVNNLKAKEELKDCYDCYFPNSDTFEFCRPFTHKDPCHKDYVEEANDNIRAFMDEATIYCSKDDIDIEVLFVYTISKHQLVKSKLQEAGQLIKGKGEGYSFNDETGAIGIDFNWRTDNIDDFLSEVEKEVPFVKVNVHEDHRFKCKVNTQLVGYDELKAMLEDKYDDIDISNDSVYQ